MIRNSEFQKPSAYKHLDETKRFNFNKKCLFLKCFRIDE
jgi:hypothetical protein